MSATMFVLFLFMLPVFDAGSGKAGAAVTVTQTAFASQELCESAADKTYRTVDQLYGNSGFHPKTVCVKTN